MTDKKPIKPIFTKGGKGGPGRPRKDKSKPEAVSSTNIRRRFFNVFWDEITEKELKDLISTKKNRMLFLQEIRRMLPATQEFDKASQDFKPLQLIIASESDSKAIDKLTADIILMEAGIKTLQGELSKRDRFIEAYEKTLKKHGLMPDIKEEPIDVSRLSQSENGVFKDEGEQLLEESEEDNNYKVNAPRRKD